MTVPFTLTSTTATVVLDFMPKIIDLKHPNFAQVVDLLKSGRATPELLTPLLDIPKAIETFTAGQVYVKDGKLFYQGCEVRTSLGRKIMQFVRQGDATLAEPLKAFLVNVQQNPDPRAAQDLFDWIDASDMPITTDGYVLAWKAVTDEYRSLHCPGDARFDHHVGNVVSMPRDECDANPDQTCSTGLHFCGFKYLKSYLGGGARIMAVKIHPRDIVSFPTDYHLQKGRACSYEIVGEVPGDRVKEFYPQGVPVYSGFTKAPTTTTHFATDLKIELGGVYRCRDGSTCVVVQLIGFQPSKAAVAKTRGTSDTQFVFVNTGRGNRDGERPYDLIERIKFPLEVQDFKVGDRWINRLGVIVTIDSITDPASQLGFFTDTTGRSYTFAGRANTMIEVEHDLVFNLDYKRKAKVKATPAPRLSGFAVGQVWQTRNRQQVTITSIDGMDSFPIIASNGASYHVKGGNDGLVAFYRAVGEGRSPIDLIALITDVA